MSDIALRVIQVGLGGFGSSWARIAQECDSVTLAGVVDPAPAARQWAEDELGFDPGAIFASLDDALTSIKCEAVLVITPPATHHAVAAAALLADKHVLVEKPLVTTITEARDLIATADREGRTLMVSQNYRYRNPARAIQAFIGAGGFGDLLSVSVSFRRDTRTLWPPDNFRYHMKHPTVLDMAIHHLDLMRMLTGRDITRIDARSCRVPGSPYVHDPAVSALIDLDGGVPAVYHGDWATTDAETSWNGDWVFTGERGKVTWVGDASNPLIGSARFESWDGDAHTLPQAPLIAEDRLGSLLAFRHSVLSGSDPETSARDNIWSLAAVNGCVDSIERGAPVDVAALVAHDKTARP